MKSLEMPKQMGEGVPFFMKEKDILGTLQPLFQPVTFFFSEKHIFFILR